MKRRQFVASMIGTGLIVPGVGATHNEKEKGHQGHGEGEHDRSVSNVTVSFGAWPQIDRLNLPPGPPPNLHHLIPHDVVLKRGGTVNFIVAGFHQIVVYAPPKKVDDVNVALTAPTPGAPPGFPPIIDDPDHRVFRGVMAFGQPLDRVEVVHFPNRGRHLVICAFTPHFNDAEKMYGWVRVV